MNPVARVTLRLTRAELAAAENAVQRMQAAHMFSDFRQAWQDLLNRLAKVWIKSERECQPIRNEFLPWQGSYKRVIRTDPLLAYVSHARNADYHTIQPIAAIAIDIQACLQPGGTAVIEVHNRDERVRLTGEMKEASVSQPKCVLLPITDSGVAYAVPTEHLGETISNNDPLPVAQLALAFYTKFVAEAAARFEH